MVSDYRRGVKIRALPAEAGCACIKAASCSRAGGSKIRNQIAGPRLRTRTPLPMREVKARWRGVPTTSKRKRKWGCSRGVRGTLNWRETFDLPRSWRWILRRNGVHCVESRWATHVENEIFAQPQEHPRSLSPDRGANGQLGTLNDREKAATRSTAPHTRPRSQSPSQEAPGRRQRKLMMGSSRTLGSVVAKVTSSHSRGRRREARSGSP